MSELLLNIAGQKYGGWLKIRARRSLETIADSFELSVTERWKGQTTRRPIAAGTACNISIDGERVITGAVDDVVPGYDSEQHSVEVTGRSKAGDLVDCSFFSTEDFKGKTFDVVVKKVCTPFDIDVIVNTDVGAAFTKTQKIEPGETVFEFLDRLARYRGLRLVSTASGSLMITRTGSKRVKTVLRLGDNILSASGRFSYRDRFSQYKVMGQTTGNDNLFGAASAESFGLYSDSGINRYRPTVIIADGSINTDECKRQAKWQRNTHMGRSGAIVYTVMGWRHADGLWQPNMLVPVDDPYMDVKADRLITEVRYLLDERGERAEIQVMRPEAFDLSAAPEDGGDESGWLDAGPA